MILNLKNIHKFYCYKNPIILEDADIKNVFLRTRFLLVKKKNYKYFIGYLYDDYKIKPFIINASKN